MIKVIKITKADFYRSHRLGSSQKNILQSKSTVCTAQFFVWLVKYRCFMLSKLQFFIFGDSMRTQIMGCTLLHDPGRRSQVHRATGSGQNGVLYNRLQVQVKMVCYISCLS